MTSKSRYLAELQSHRSEHTLGLATIPVFVDGPSDLSADLQAIQVQRGLDYVSQNFSLLLDFICQELLDLKNDAWLKDNEAPVSYENFRAQLTPRRIRILEDGSIEIGFADADMFRGHEIVLRTDHELKPIWADIEG
jgi:hypothetical protein